MDTGYRTGFTVIKILLPAVPHTLKTGDETLLFTTVMSGTVLQKLLFLHVSLGAHQT